MCRVCVWDMIRWVYGFILCNMLIFAIYVLLCTVVFMFLCSNIGSDDRRTRTAYRNRMKREAFDLMRDIAANLGIHKSVLLRAREE